MNLTVIKQWFSLIFRGEAEIIHLDEEWVSQFLTDLAYQNEEEIYILEALYCPMLNVLQVVARAPQPDYARIKHLSAEQYTRVLSQTFFLFAGAEEYARVVSQSLALFVGSVGVKNYPVIVKMLRANPDAAYYRRQSLRFKRAIRPTESFVLTMGLTSIREVKGIWQINTILTDGPFIGELDALVLPNESMALADMELSSACYTIWQEIAHRFKSTVLRFATGRLHRRLFFLPRQNIPYILTAFGLSEPLQTD